jgi:cystathionine beta-lyase/cystathionine gamma-synthase
LTNNKKYKYGFETASIHTGERPDRAYGAISVPIYLTSNFAFSDFGKTKGYDYSRSGNPTRKVLEDTIAKLEGGKAGFAFATGMAASTTVIHLLKAGDHVICGDDIYGGSFRLFDTVMRNFGIQFTFLRLNDRKRIEKAIKPNTKMIWLESPSNPLLNIIDLELIVNIARRHKLLTVMDNTFASPLFLRPIEFGIDLVVHSTTKYINGHCDVIGGAVITTTDELTERVQFLLNAMGTPASPFDCWLVLRGIETLALRVRQHEKNAFAVAEFLQGHAKVERVYFPGLPSHSGHEIAARQMKGFGGMVSFEIKDGINGVKRFLRKVELFRIAESLGGPVSLAEHPSTMSHASMPAGHRRKAGIKDCLIRLSIGLETADDLIMDIEKALKSV